MSFFSDILEYFKIDKLGENLAISMVVGMGLVVLGNVKILNLNDSFIDLSYKKQLLHIYGDNLKIKSAARGEFVVCGNITRIEVANGQK